MQLAYQSGTGLLSQLTDPGATVHTFGYDSAGRLVSDRSASGHATTLTRERTTNGFRVRATSAGGQTVEHLVAEASDHSVSNTVTPPTPAGSNLATTRTTTTAGVETTSSPGGVTVTRQLSADPRFGSDVPLETSRTTQIPGVPDQTIARSRTAAWSGSDRLALQQITDRHWINLPTTDAHYYESSYDATTRTLVTRSATGRRTQTLYDADGRVTQVALLNTDGTPRFRPLGYSYDATGRLATAFRVEPGMQAPVRISTNTYYPVSSGVSSSGLLQRVDGPPSLAKPLWTTFDTYDGALRLRQQTSSGDTARVVAFGYDADSHLTSLTPPGRSAHTFTPDLDGQLSVYTPPALGTVATPTTYTRNADWDLTGVDLPGSPTGTAVRWYYDAYGRPERRERVRTGYTTEIARLRYDTAGRVDQLTAPNNGLVTRSFAGPFLTQEVWSAGSGIQGTVARTFNARHLVATQSVNADAVAYGYDLDGVLTAAGALGVTPDPVHGLEVGTSIGAGAGLTTTARTYNAYGELEAETTTAGSPVQERFYRHYDYDAAGRITTVIERVEGGAAQTSEYQYDAAGRLWKVLLGGVLTQQYEYDANGNRLRTTAGAPAWSYDAQDRLTARPGTPNVAYAYSRNGELATRTDGAGTWSFQYDEQGLLRTVFKPSQDYVAYTHDGAGRRIARQRWVYNAALETWSLAEQQRFLYDGARLVAQLDGANAVGSRFVYGTKPHVPDYMVRGGVNYRLVTDHLGSVRLVINASTGSVVQRMRYDAFGRVQEDWAATGFERVPFGYAGGLYDRESGLVRFGARDYDAEIGRWTSKDASGLAGGLNLYAYAANDPVDYIDADGHHPVLALIAIGLAIVLAPDDMTAYSIAAGELGGAVAGACLGAAAGWAMGRAAAEGVTTLQSSEVLFSQGSVNGVEAIANSMRASGWVGEPINVVAMEGRLITVDNTRVLAAHLTGTPVQAVVRGAGDALPASMAGRFVSRAGVEATTWGEAVLTRIANQSAAFRSRFPLGSWFTGVGQ